MTTDPDRIAYWLLKSINQAIYEYGMIADGDRVAVAVSGGKDSLSLLKLLDLRRQMVTEKYELVAIHIIGDSEGSGLQAHGPLIEWLENNHYQHAEVALSLPEGEALPLNCHRCTWNRRRTLFETAHRLGCNVIAFGHHADDLAQTTLLNLLFHGRVETMEPRRDYFDGIFRLVRPLCYVLESEMRRYARINAFPSPPPLCPQSDHSRRRMVANLLHQVEGECPNARTNLIRAGLRSNDRWFYPGKEIN